jgi:Xaa-Pro aminopeptidase/Xaa-Pro dipeptidase
MVAGEPLCEVDAAAQAVIEQAGLGRYIIHRTGHGIGIAGHEEPADMAFNPRPLLAGEVLSSEPGIYIYGLGGFRHDDTVIVGLNGPEVVTTTTLALEEMVL